MVYRERNQYDTQGRKTQYWEEENQGFVEKGNYVDGVRDGIWTVHNKNGTLASIGKYVDGERSGVWGYWRSGKLISVDEYTSGQLSANSTDLSEEQPKNSAVLWV